MAVNENMPISKSVSFHSIFRDQQLQLKRLQSQLLAVKRHNAELSGENTQLKIAIAAGTNTPVSSKQRFRSAPFQTDMHLASYESHIQTLQRDKQCARVELDTATRHLSDARETVDMLELQIDRIHREYRSKLIALMTPHYTQPSATDVLCREIRGSYTQQLNDLRERCRVYRGQAFKLRSTEKELRVRQTLLEHTTHSCMFQESCIEVCMLVVKYIEAYVDNGYSDIALIQACALLRQTLTKFLPQLFQKYSTDLETCPDRERNQWELVGLYDHLIDEIQTYKLM